MNDLKAVTYNLKDSQFVSMLFKFYISPAYDTVSFGIVRNPSF